ncbi:hypothetical protein WJX74_003152 [Apatococcus lobatus]|uniref:Mitotic-spindle organizing protein 1 n=1 Tax=Apatococcus lobatus TaxID=904363 RepID=A0AAW1SAM0_9CHLO
MQLSEQNLQPFQTADLQGTEALDIAFEISQILDTGLDRKELAILIALLETGVNPEALAAVVKELKREAAALRAAESDH